MQLGIDLDGTIAGRNIKKFAQACCEQFQFSLEPGASISYRALMSHPVMQRQATQEHFEHTIACIEQSPDMLRSVPVLPGAVAGLEKLAQHATTIGYYTVRKAYAPYVDRDIEEATTDWLRASGFPQPDQVTFCMSIMNKLLQIYRRLRTDPGPFLLIDDMAPTLAVCYARLRSGSHPALSPRECEMIADTLREFLILVAFGPLPSTAINSDIPVYILSDWNGVDDLIEMCLSVH